MNNAMQQNLLKILFGNERIGYINRLAFHRKTSAVSEINESIDIYLNEMFCNSRWEDTEYFPGASNEIKEKNQMEIEAIEAIHYGANYNY